MMDDGLDWIGLDWIGLDWIGCKRASIYQLTPTKYSIADFFRTVVSLGHGHSNSTFGYNLDIQWSWLRGRKLDSRRLG
jgi:hypothetical protein